MNRPESTKQWYQEYYAKKGQDRNDLRRNREVLFQTLATEGSVVKAVHDIDHDPRKAAVLDVGCGGGGDLYQLLRLGYEPARITGIDILSERLERARQLYPNIKFIQADASQMEFSDESFDLVFESTMFATLPNDVLSAGIAREMVRVCKPGGYLLLVDWWTPKPRDPNYKALTRKRLWKLLAVDNDTELLGVYRGALVPPLGRRLSKWLPSMYFVAAGCFPFLVGQVAYLLRKRVQSGAGS